MAEDIVLSVRKLRGHYALQLSSGDSLRVPLPLFRRHPLKEGQAFSKADYLARLEKEAYPLALERAARMLSQRDYTVYQVEQKLLEAGYAEATTRRVSDYLQQRRFLDDERYAQNLLRRKQQKMGSRGIRMALRQKGVPAQVAEQAMDALSDEDQLSAATALAQKYLARKAWEPIEARQKGIAFLARRGFGYDLARRAVSTVVSSEEE